MLIRACRAAVRVAARLCLWGSYAAFVAIVTASWISGRGPASEVPPAIPLGAATDGGEAERERTRRAVAIAEDAADLARAGLDAAGPVFGPPAPPAAPRGERGAAPEASDDSGAIEDAGGAAPTGAPGDDAAGDSPRSSGELAGRININRAGARELQMLPGIGEAISARIVAWRDDHGRFPRVVDLRRVRGIGPVTMADLRPHLTVNSATTLRADE